MSTTIENDPTYAPLRRKLLALRVLTVNAITLVATVWLVDALDGGKPKLPHWLVVVLMLPALAAGIGFFINLVNGLADLVVHFVPHGWWRKALLSGNRSPEEIATEFRDSGFIYALSPIYVTLTLLAVALACVLLSGGVAAIGGVFALMSGWPSWAIVITILLVLLLLKK